MKRCPAFILSGLCALSIAQTQSYSSSVDMSKYTEITSAQKQNKVVETESTTEFNEIITLGLGEKLYGYIGIDQGAVTQLQELQSQYDDSLASADVIKVLGAPQSEIPQGTSACKEGSTGERKTFFYLIKGGYRPLFMAIIPFCNDAMQSVSIQRIA